ncbi:unnamed protein product [Rotaria sp. Silwood2]|nr:unnamed protein product [Rotaria sp. Silwood2]CAF4055464.1 unnamed protein product [Rotaria sp. Silwood2]
MKDKLILEQLPNEIFQELFEYFDICELYKTFSQLNFPLHLSGPITRDFIDSILSFVSNLENFVLDIKYQRPSYISLNTLASIFEYRTPRLNRVNINMTLPESLCCKEQMDTKYSLFTACKIQPELNQLTRLIVVGSLRR